MGKNLLLWLIIAAVLLTVFNNFNVEPQQEPVAYSEFVKAVNAGQIREAQIQGDKITALDGSGNRMVVVWPQNDDKLISELIDNNVVTTVLEPEKQSFWSQLLIASFPILIIIAVFMLFMRQMQGGGSGRGGPMA
ncbi:MAG: ATP-dependent metallopeptidase FtsH/Yme1/Tma family protein, partial [Pseudomonadales bacterium]|nr:ATP-dependent metallopeptidase FtsH/Yme1/Tma family protein [Pseudomonadales bacterium]